MSLEIVDNQGCKYILYAELENHIQRNIYNLVKSCQQSTLMKLNYNDEI